MCITVFTSLVLFWSVQIGINQSELLSAIFLRFGHFYQTYQQWPKSPVLTSVRTTRLPLSEVGFPAIRVCRQVRTERPIKLFFCHPHLHSHFALSWGYISEVPRYVFLNQLREFVAAKTGASNLGGLTDEEWEQLRGNITA